MITQEQISGTKRNLSQTADAPLDIATSKTQFEFICEIIMSSCNYSTSTSLFKTLHGLTNRLLYTDEKYRIIDTRNIRLDNTLLKYNGVVRFLKLLGFAEDFQQHVLKLVYDQPPLDVLERARNVCSNYIGRCNEKTEAIDAIKQFKLLRIQSKLSTANKSISTSKSTNKASTRSAQNKIDNINDTECVHLSDIVWVITDDNSVDSIPTLTNNMTEMIKDTLLLTHKRWTTTMDLLNCIQDRLFNHGQKDDDHNYSNCNDVDDEKYDIIRSSFKVSVKCTNLLQQWLTTYWIDDFDQDKRLIERLTEIIEAAKKYFTANAHDPTTTEKQLKLLCALKKDIDKRIAQSKILNNTMVDSEKKLDDSDDEDGVKTRFLINRKTKFIDLDNKKIAQEMTLMDFEIFCQIKRRECLSQSWKKINKEKLSPNVCLLINQFDKVTKWVQLTILNADNEKIRGKIIEKFIKILDQLFQVRNFQSLGAVFSGLNCSAIFYLKPAWSHVKSKYMARYQDFKLLFSAMHNMSNLRKAHRETQPPMIPYSGICLKDIVAVDEGTFKRRGCDTVNFARMIQLRDSMNNALSYQLIPYDQIEQDVLVRQFILNQFKINENVDDDLLYIKAKAIRTKQRKQLNQKSDQQSN